MAKQPEPLACPVYLSAALARRWEQLAPELQALGTVDALSADLLGKYILAENEYLRISALVQETIARGDAEDAGKWIGAQDKLTKQILGLADVLGITPKARRARGIVG